MRTYPKFPSDVWNEWLSDAEELAIMQVWLPVDDYPLVRLNTNQSMRGRIKRIRVLIAHWESPVAHLRSVDQAANKINVANRIAENLGDLEETAKAGANIEVRLVMHEGMIPFQLYALPGRTALQASFYPKRRASQSIQFELDGEALQAACEAFDDRWDSSKLIVIGPNGYFNAALLAEARGIVKQPPPRPSNPFAAVQPVAPRARESLQITGGPGRPKPPPARPGTFQQVLSGQLLLTVLALAALAALVQVTTGKPLVAGSVTALASVLCITLVFFSKRHVALSIKEKELALRAQESADELPAEVE